MTTVPWSRCADGLRLAVRVTPKAHQDAVDGIETAADVRPVLRARVRAAPDKGAANGALIGLLADRLGVPRAAILLERGAGARQKSLRLVGDPDRLAAGLLRLVNAAMGQEKR